MPSATGENWEKYKKNFADEEEPEKKITPLTDEYVSHCWMVFAMHSVGFDPVANLAAVTSPY